MAELALCLALLPLLVQEGVLCLCKETLRAHPSPNLCACLRLLPSLLHPASPAPHPHRACHPPAQGSPNNISSLSRTCTMGKRQARANSWGTFSHLGVSNPLEILSKFRAGHLGGTWASAFFRFPGELMQESPLQSSHSKHHHTLVPNHHNSHFQYHLSSSTEPSG